MKSILLLAALFCSVVFGQKAPFIKLPALNARRHVEIGQRYLSEIECIRKLDSVLKARWTEELAKISTTDLRDLPDLPWEDKDSAYPKYNTLRDEWLMESGSPTKKIYECVQEVLSDVKVPVNKQNDLRCLTELMSTNSFEETYYQWDFENLINTSSRAQLPFRKFISFPEVVDLIFQNRDPQTWTNVEGLLYAHAMSYVITDADKADRKYFASLNCDWVNAKALKDAPTEAAKLQEFISQVRHSVNIHLAGRLVKDWNLDEILPTEKYQRWLKARRDMMSKLESEVDKLRNQVIDDQRLCEYATELAMNFADVQSSILLSEDYSSMNLEAADVAAKARAIETALANLNDTRHTAITKIADKQDEGMTCLSSLLHFVQNHRRYELASEFVDEKFEYPEIYCEDNIKNAGLIRFTFCNCIGSFCVSHDLVALFEEEYVLVKDSNGVFKIVRSGIKSKRKVMHCHTLANSSSN